MTPMEGSVYLFGGTAPGEAFNDLWRFDPSACFAGHVAWQKVVLGVSAATAEASDQMAAGNYRDEAEVGDEDELQGSATCVCE